MDSWRWLFFLVDSQRSSSAGSRRARESNEHSNQVGCWQGSLWFLSAFSFFFFFFFILIFCFHRRSSHTTLEKRTVRCRFGNTKRYLVHSSFLTASSHHLPTPTTADEIIEAILSAFRRALPEFKVENLFSLKVPEIRIPSTNVPSTPCGGFSRAYKTVADYYGLPVRKVEDVTRPAFREANTTNALL